MYSHLALVTKFFFLLRKCWKQVFFIMLFFHWFRSGFACWILVPNLFLAVKYMVPSNILELATLSHRTRFKFSWSKKNNSPKKLEISWWNPLSPFSVKLQGFKKSCGFWILFCWCCFRLAVVVVDKRNKLTVLSHICFNTNSIDVVVLGDAVSLNEKVYEKSE